MDQDGEESADGEEEGEESSGRSSEIEENEDDDLFEYG